jgi:diguanylate cyclase (GGDEF)-like protein
VTSAPPAHLGEGARLSRLHDYDILDAPLEESLDPLTQLASHMLDMPIAIISLIDADRIWFKSKLGVDIDGLPRASAFCDHAIRTPEVMVVEDATRDPRFVDNPLVLEAPKVRAYVGAPLITADGHRIGTLCGFDTKPRTLSDAQRASLADLATIVIEELDRTYRLKCARAMQTTLMEAINALPDGFVLFDKDDRLVACNGPYREVYQDDADVVQPGVRFEDLLKFGLERGVFPVPPGTEEAWFQERVERHRDPGGTVEVQVADGRWYRIEERRTSDGGMVGFRIDITELKRREAALRKMASCDSLTDLPNRTAFHERLRAAIANAGRTGRQVGLLLLDIDHFKRVNDSHGHVAGDALLKMAAERILECCRRTDTVARLGGDEFAVISANIKDAAGATALADRFIAAFDRPFPFQGKELHSGVSIGITVFPNDESDVEGLVRNADVALYRAKTEGRGGWRLFDGSLQEEADRQRTIERDLRVAIKNGELFPYFQPQINVATRRVIGAEALQRWQHPERGMISPADFISIAEATRLIVPITEALLWKVCAQNMTWQAQGLPPIVTSINVSPVEFNQRGFSRTVRAALDDTGLDPSLLELEITEHSAMDHRADTMRIFNELRTLGVRIAIDDFGTGYSSLSRLKSFQVNRLKIDQSFVRDITIDRDDEAICTSVIRLGQSLDIEVIAEGVETAQQMRVLRELNCTEMQGYYFARPMPADEFAAYVLDFEADRRAEAS